MPYRIPLALGEKDICCSGNLYIFYFVQMCYNICNNNFQTFKIKHGYFTVF